MKKQYVCKSDEPSIKLNQLKESHSKHYYEQGRNGWASDSSNNTENPLKEFNFKEELLKMTNNITELLINKNAAYGNTALNPANVFSKLNPREAICARIDDKLSRISNRGINDKTEDTIDDLIGYLLLLKMAMNENK